MMIIYTQCRKVDKAPESCCQMFYNGTAPFFTEHTDLLFFFLTLLKNLYTQGRKTFFPYHKAKCTFLLGTKAQHKCHTAEMHISLDRIPVASGSSWRSHSAVTAWHLPVTGGTRILVWFIRAPFWVPFSSVFQLMQKKYKTSTLQKASALHLSFQCSLSFQHHGKTFRSIMSCWESTIWKDALTKSEQR